MLEQKKTNPKLTEHVCLLLSTVFIAAVTKSKAEG